MWNHVQFKGLGFCIVCFVWGLNRSQLRALKCLGVFQLSILNPFEHFANKSGSTSIIQSWIIIFNEILFFQIFRQFKRHLNGTKWDLKVSWNPWCIGALGRSGTSAVPAYGKGVLTDLFSNNTAVTRSTRKNTHRNTHRDTSVIIESLSSITWSKIHWFRTIQKLQWRLHGDRSTVHLRCRLSWLERMTSHRAKQLAPLRAVDSMTWRCRFPWTPL